MPWHPGRVLGGGGDPWAWVVTVGVTAAAARLALAPVLFVAERIAPEWPDASVGPRRRAGRGARVTDWTFALIGLAVAPAIWSGISNVVGTIGPYTPLHTVFGGLPWAAGSAVGFVLADLVAYWGHRWEHQVRLLWRVHAVHHSSEHPRLLSGRRFHPLDLVVQQLYPIAVVGVLGVPLASLEPYLIVVTVLAHCDLVVPVGR